MNQAELQQIADWIATDPSDLAARCRAALRPLADGVVEAVQQFERWAVRYDHHRRRIMRRKLARLRFRV